MIYLEYIEKYRLVFLIAWLPFLLKSSKSTGQKHYRCFSEVTDKWQENEAHPGEALSSGEPGGGGGQNAEADLRLGDTCWTGQMGQTGLGLFMAHREGALQTQSKNHPRRAVPKGSPSSWAWDTKGLYHQRKAKWEVNLLSSNPKYTKQMARLELCYWIEERKISPQRTYNLAPALTSIFSLPLHSLGGLKNLKAKI